MIDPLPDGYVGLDEAVVQLAADISDQEVLAELRHRLENSKQILEALRHHYPEKYKQISDPPALPEELNPVELAWAKRELAIWQLYAALRDGALIGLVRDPVSNEWFRLTYTDWHAAAFWRGTIVGGIVQAAAGEEIARHKERRVLLGATAFDAWLKALIRRRPQPAEVACRTWLEGMMRDSPKQRPKPKSQLRKDAEAQFSVSGRMFDRIWDEKLEITGANWGEPGAPSKLPR